MSGFQRAVKTQAKARVALYGVGGSGKTMHALGIARALAGDGRIALLDGEGGSSAKYADLFDFDMQVISPPYHPARFATALEDAVKAGYTVFVADGITPFWSGSGGVQSIVDSSPKRWAEGTPAHLKLINAILDAPIHVVLTIRAKGETLVETNAQGKVTRMQKVGLKPDTRDGIEYEVDALLYCDVADNSFVIEKSRWPGQLNVKIPVERAHEWNEGYAAWLAAGAAPPEPPTAAPPPPPAAPAPSADPTGGLGPAPAQAPSQTPAPGTPEAGSAPTPAATEVREAIRARIKAAVGALTPHDAEIGAKVATKIPEWFGGLAREADLSDAQADELATKLEATLQSYQGRASA